MKVLVCGSRYKDASIVEMIAVSTAICRRLDELPQESLVITGGAAGVDRWADKHAGHRGLSRRTMKADWERYGKRAGIVRNLAMLDQQPDLVIAFWDGKSTGTKHTIDEATKRGIPVEVISP